MDNAFYQLLVIAIALIGVFRGYRKGFIDQISGVLGFAFGTVCCHVFAEPGEDLARNLFPGIANHLGADFIYSIIGAATIYLSVFLAFSLLTTILKSAMQVFSGGLLNSLLGAFFCMLKYLLFLSVAFNIIVCVSPRSALMKAALCDDGNAVEAVMALAPALLGSLSYEDLGHIVQLEDAKKISANLSEHHNVILSVNPSIPDRLAMKYDRSAACRSEEDYKL